MLGSSFGSRSSTASPLLISTAFAAGSMLLSLFLRETAPVKTGLAIS